MLDFERACEHVIAILVVALGAAAIPARAEEPYLVQDIWPGPDDSVLMMLYAVNDLAFFRATDGTDGFELYRSDGTELGTFRIEDLRPGLTGSNPSTFGDLSGHLLFNASDGVDAGLWRTDGAVGSISLVKGNIAITAGWLERMNDHVYFAAAEIGESGGKELWKSDGTLVGTVRVKDIYPGNLASSPEHMVAVGDTLYFAANDGTRGVELWSSDGSEPGTDIVLDINPGPFWSIPEELTRVGDRLFLTAYNLTGGGELWVVDGGSASIIDICSGACSGDARGITAVGDLAYFRSLGDGTTTTGAELWRSDGTDAGTWKVKEIAPGPTPAYISLITDFDGTLFYFIADDGVNGSELWRSDGTAAGTWMVKDINPSGDSMSNVSSEIVTAGGLIYFSADDGVHDVELWRSDGTEAGTIMAYDFHPADDGYPALFTPIGDLLLFAAGDADHGYELWALAVSLFFDGFETGDTSAWSSEVGGSP